MRDKTIILFKVSIAKPILPNKYWEYIDIFSKKNTNIIPVYIGHNYIIDLEPGKKPPYKPLYLLLEKELQILYKYI